MSLIVNSFDLDVQQWMLTHQHPTLATLAFLTTTAGGITGMRVLSVLGALDLWRRGRRRRAACALAVALAAFALFTVMKRVLARPRPSALDGSISDDFSFPSGHATMSAAVCCTIAWLYWRAGLVGRGPALALAIIVPLIVGISRVYLNVHWATDVLGGWSAGLLIAVVAAALCDGNRSRRESDSAMTIRSSPEL
jgi:undecaprenyl-diphosphatase